MHKQLGPDYPEFVPTYFSTLFHPLSLFPNLREDIFWEKWKYGHIGKAIILMSNSVLPGHGSKGIIYSSFQPVRNDAICVKYGRNRSFYFNTPAHIFYFRSHPLAHADLYDVNRILGKMLRVSMEIHKNILFPPTWQAVTLDIGQQQRWTGSANRVWVQVATTTDILKLIQGNGLQWKVFRAEVVMEKEGRRDME